MKIVFTLADHKLMPVIQNMARFYSYDLSKSCGFYDLYDWSFPENGLYDALDVSEYWEKDHFPFMIYVDNEIAGFALINKKGKYTDTDWNMGEFFIVGKFQGKGVGKHVAIEIFKQFPGNWEVAQMPMNYPAIEFWRKVVDDFTLHRFSFSRETLAMPKSHECVLLRFASS